MTLFEGPASSAKNATAIALTGNDSDPRNRDCTMKPFWFDRFFMATSLLPRLLLAALLTTALHISGVADAAENAPVISINFAKNLTMAPDEKAGVMDAAHWNSATEQAGTLNPLIDSQGKPVDVSVEWVGGQASWNNAEIQDEPGSARMMKEYLDANQQSPTTITLSGLAKAYAGKPYDVIVYTDGQNTWASRVTEFQIGETILCAKDKGNSSFIGDFEEAPPAGTSEEAQAGNFVSFRKLATDSVTLEVRPGLSKDPWPRGVICGLQIVPAQD